MSKDFSFAWSCIFDAFYQLKDKVPKYYNLLGWTIDMSNSHTQDKHACISAMSDNMDPLPLARWFGTDTTNTTMEDMKNLFDRFDVFNLCLVFRNNGVEIQQSETVTIIKADPMPEGSCNWGKLKASNNGVHLTGIYLKGKKNESTNSIQENKQECITPET